MEGFDPLASFGPDVAERYDEDLRRDEPETVDFLAALAGDPRWPATRPTNARTTRPGAPT